MIFSLLQINQTITHYRQDNLNNERVYKPPRLMRFNSVGQLANIQSFLIGFSLHGVSVNHEISNYRRYTENHHRIVLVELLPHNQFEMIKIFIPTRTTLKLYSIHELIKILIGVWNSISSYRFIEDKMFYYYNRTLPALQNLCVFH